MKDKEFIRMTNLSADIALEFSSGKFTEGALIKVEETIEYLNIQIDYQEKPKTIELSDYHQLIELCWQYYRLKDFYITNTK